MTLADHHMARAQLRVLESVPAPVIPLHEPSIDEEMCREAAYRLRAMADELPCLSMRLCDVATYVERAHTPSAVRGARALLNHDLSDGVA